MIIDNIDVSSVFQTPMVDVVELRDQWRIIY